jgi:hypothetical protein
MDDVFPPASLRGQSTRRVLVHRLCSRALLVTAVFVVGASTAAADPIRVDTVGPGGLSNVVVGSFGEPFGTTAGQSFVVPPGARQLDRFTFFMLYVEGGPTRFAGYLAGWDGQKATEPLLYTSDERQIATPERAIPVTFETGGIRVTPGQRYVAFLSNAPFWDGIEDNSNLYLQGNTYDGGGYVGPTTRDFSQIFDVPWRGLDPLDLAFTAEFSAVPEPSTMLLVGSGLAAAAAAKRRRRTNRRDQTT